MKKSIADIKIGSRYRKDMGDIASLAASISKVGLLHPVVIDQAGNLIAGQRRIEAAKSLKWTSIDVRVINIPAILLGELDENAVRKEFSPLEMVAIGRAILEYEKAHAKERQGKRTDLELVGKLPTSKDKQRAKDKVAKAVGTSRKTYEKAEAVVEAAEKEPEKYRDLTGLMLRSTPTAAMRELNKRKRQQEIERMDALPDAKYRVVYADPPWHYDNSGMLDNYGHAERHYATMTVEELCALDIKSLTEDDAVLFLWVTSPMLPDAFPVIKAWGFTYKASFVWDKMSHNYGHYNSVRHELLLIATRGSCIPNEGNKFKSVQSWEKSTTHSEKPEHFRSIIDTLYPQGKRVELFARTENEGWDRWGSQAPTSVT